MSCRACEGIEQKFDRKKAHKELERLRRRGPRATTRRLIERLRTHVRNGDSLLDIGGGVGAIHHVLLDAGVRDAIHLDASNGYIEVAREEAATRGHSNRVRFMPGDFVAIADSVPSADVVTLDRVICCYPDMDAMVSLAADKARRVLGAVYPRDAWWVRVALTLENILSRARRSAFRAYLHSPTAIEARLEEKGFTRASLHRTMVWEVTTFLRSPNMRSVPGDM